LLSRFEGKFILSTWYKNKYRENEYIKRFWSKFNVTTRNHFYHVGGKEINRNPIIEALVINFKPREEDKITRGEQTLLLKIGS